MDEKNTIKNSNDLEVILEKMASEIYKIKDDTNRDIISTNFKALKRELIKKQPKKSVVKNFLQVLDHLGNFIQITSDFKNGIEKLTNIFDISL